MAFNEQEIEQINRVLAPLVEELRPPVDIRDQVDFTFEINSYSVILIELRPDFVEPLLKLRIPIAKATYTKCRDIWTVYWQRANGKWNKYQPEPTVSNLKLFFRVVKEDKYGCFFG